MCCFSMFAYTCLRVLDSSLFCFFTFEVHSFAYRALIQNRQQRRNWFKIQIKLKSRVIELVINSKNNNE